MLLFKNIKSILQDTNLTHFQITIKHFAMQKNLDFKQIKNDYYFYFYRL